MSSPPDSVQVCYFGPVCIWNLKTVFTGRIKDAGTVLINTFGPE